MARARKKTASRSKSSGKGRKITRRKSSRKPGRTGSTGRSKGRATSSATGGNADVEKRWREYWSCRKQLEDSMAAVRQAEEDLSAARAEERSHREAFNKTKNALKSLLEVEPASGARDRTLTLMEQPPTGGSGRGEAPPASR